MTPLIPNRAAAEVERDSEYFEGEVAMQALVPPEDDNEVEVRAVWFKDGARTRPHIHSVDQILVILEGVCLLATRENQIEIHTGDSARIPKGEWHWHGAAPGTSICHLSIKKPGPTNWNPPD